MISHKKDSHESTRIIESHKGFERSSTVQFSCVWEKFRTRKCWFPRLQVSSELFLTLFPTLIPFKGLFAKSHLFSERINQRKANNKNPTASSIFFAMVVIPSFKPSFFWSYCSSSREWTCVNPTWVSTLYTILVVFHPFCFKCFFLFWQPITLFSFQYTEVTPA